jgi:DNA replication and repair protein RecF
VSLTRLSLSNFRCYTDAVIAPGPAINILTGENGAGKTNVLEAISLLVPGRGLRGAALSDMARKGGSGGFSVSGRLDEIDLGVGTLAEAPDRRLVRINGVQKSANALSEWLAIVWLTPAMDRLFTDTASGRRRFLDRLVLALNPAHATHTTRYEAAMRQRNRLLADEREHSKGADPDWLTALEQQMAEHGAAVSMARTDLVTALATRLAAQAEGPFARAGLSLEGEAHMDLGPILLQSRARDAAAGRTLSGPHRQDIVVTHQGKGQAAAQCSTGEQKALLLGIVLAHADLVAEARGTRPILVLDEVAAHLDPLRRAALFERLQTGGQVWMTGTESSLFAEVGEKAHHFKVENARVERVL